MKLFVILLFLKGAEMVGGVLAGTAMDAGGCHDVAVEYITAHKADIVLHAGEQAAIAVYCMLIPEAAPAEKIPEVKS